MYPKTVIMRVSRKTNEVNGFSTCKPGAMLETTMNLGLAYNFSKPDREERFTPEERASVLSSIDRENVYEIITIG